LLHSRNNNKRKEQKESSQLTVLSEQRIIQLDKLQKNFPHSQLTVSKSEID
jgi:hypothetical protein